MNYINEKNIKKIIQSTAGQTETSPELDNKILARMKEVLERKKNKRKIINFFQYSPALSYALVFLLFIPILILGAFRVFIPANMNDHPFVVLSSGSCILESKNKILNSGYTLKENDIVKVIENKLTDIKAKEEIFIRFFSMSEFLIQEYSQSSNKIAVQLNKGSMYIDKNNLPDDKKFFVYVNDYMIMFTGTRASIDYKENTYLKVVCYEGLLDIVFLGESGSKLLYTVKTNEMIEIDINITAVNYSMGLISPEDRDKDNESRYFYSFYKRILDKLIMLYGLKGRTENRYSEENEINNGPALNDVTVAVLHESYYRAEKLGRLPGAQLKENSVNYFTGIAYKESLYIIEHSGLYTVKNDIISEGMELPDSPVFKLKPFIADNYLCLVSNQNVYILNKDSLNLENTVSIKDKGIMTDNYCPVYYDGMIYLPLRNSGYYTLNISNITGDNYDLIKLYDEIFPVSPVFANNRIYFGSFYNNYIACMDKSGNILWKYILPGESYTNFLLLNNNIYTYVKENNIPKILQILDKGIRGNEWVLKQEVIADLFMYNKNVIGVDVKGNLFLLNTDTGSYGDIYKIISSEISTRDWRNLSPLIYSDKLYIGTDKGEVLVYNLGKNMIEEIIHIANESFFTQPVIIKDIVYIISNNGSIYKIFKSGK